MNKTKDLWFAAFLDLKGHEVVDYEIKSYRKGVFSFDIQDEEWKKLKLEFDKSEASKLKYRIEKLKDLIC